MSKARGPTYRVPFRRRREGKTNYRRRLKLIMSRRNRIVVRRSNKIIRMQLISTDKGGDRTLVSALSTELSNYGYTAGSCNIPAAYLTGLLFGKRATAAGYDEGIFDIGLVTPVHGSNVYASLKGALDCGMEIPHDSDVFPSDDRLNGNHIATFFEKPDIVDKIKTSKDTILSGSAPEMKEDAAAE